MAELSESNTLELRIAFHNAVSRFQAWTADVAEPRVKLHGRFCPISEVCQETITLPNPLPNAILSILYNAGPASACCGSLRSGKTRSTTESTEIVTELVKGRVIQ